jgi:predicted esterase YcpF (UPF0227 family)
MIILLHEFGATAESSYFIKTVAPHFPDEIVLSPTYPFLDANATATQLAQFVEDALNANPDDLELTFIGASLGGFWARYLANKFRWSKLIMVNPALDAKNDSIRCVTLIENKNKTSNFNFCEKAASEFDKYFIIKDHFDLPITIIVADDDNVVPSLAEELIGSHRARIIHTTGGHRMRSTLIKHIADIKFAVYNLTD